MIRHEMEKSGSIVTVTLAVAKEVLYPFVGGAQSWTEKMYRGYDEHVGEDGITQSVGKAHIYQADRSYASIRVLVADSEESVSLAVYRIGDSNNYMSQVRYKFKNRVTNATSHRLPSLLWKFYERSGYCFTSDELLGEACYANSAMWHNIETNILGAIRVCKGHATETIYDANPEE